LTAFPFSDDQVRKLARVKIEYTFLLEQNKSLTEMLTWCDSIGRLDCIALEQKDIELKLKDDMLYNREQVIIHWEEKYDLSATHVKKERRRKYLYMGTTASALALLVFSLVQ